MSLQTLFKLVTCWCAPNTVRQVVPRGRACDGEHTLAKFQTGPRDEQNAQILTVLNKLTTVVKQDNLEYKAEQITLQSNKPAKQTLETYKCFHLSER